MLETTPETQRVLVVDDNAYTLRIVQHTLEGAGYTVSTAISGPEGLKLITRYGLPHLAIVDMHMPEMSGFEFCRAIHDFSDVPVIMLTAVNTEEAIVEGLEKHAEDYIVKPFNPPELVARVRRVLARMEDYTYTLDSTTRIDERLLINFPLREALFRVTNMRDIDVDGDRAVLHKKFNGSVAKADGTADKLNWQTLYFCRRVGASWKIAGFVGYMPHPLGR